jgi:hypothetical protein
MIRLRDVEERLTNQPFVPFRIHTSRGAAHDVTHPELAKASSNWVLIFVPKPDHSFSAIEDYKKISMLHISWLEPLASTPVGKNGS